MWAWMILLGAGAVLAADVRVCARCHAEVVKRYQSTAMARTSGHVEALTPGHGTGYEITQDGFLGFEQGRRKLDIFIGAGNTGRSYASEIEGHLFQSPVSFYSKTHSWQLSPGFEQTLGWVHGAGETSRCPAR